MNRIFPCILSSAFLAVAPSWAQVDHSPEVSKARWYPPVPTMAQRQSQAYGVSADGKRVCGWNGGLGFVWTDGDTALSPAFPSGSLAFFEAMSADGEYSVGIELLTVPGSGFRRSSNGIITPLGTLGGSYSWATGVDRHGDRVVGFSVLEASSTIHAFRWEASTGVMYSLDNRPDLNSWANAVSADGSTIVGYQNEADGSVTAFRAVAPVFTREPLATADSGNYRATAVNSDGTVIVGTMNSGGPSQPWIWRASTGVVTIIPIVNSTHTEAYATGVSGDGTRVVGYGDGGGWIYSEDFDAIWIDPYLVSRGVLAASDPGVSSLNNISEDGETVVGYSLGSRYPDGDAIIISLCPDKDRDGLCDAWEVEGIPYVDLAGNAQRYILDGASPNRKDVYVEVDAMIGFAPIQSTLNQVVNAFDIAPVPPPQGVSNSEGRGIALHALLDDDSIPAQTFGTFPDTVWPQFNTVKTSYFGSPVERLSPDGDQILAVKRKAYRYCIFGDTFDGSTSSGTAELGGNDFLVSLGGLDDQNARVFSPLDPQYPSHQAGTFMHELGHTLGLQHGGHEDLNYKPNYVSVMNYTWQTPTPATVGWALRYSDAVLPTLDEGALLEGAGIGANLPGVETIFGIDPLVPPCPGPDAPSA